MKMYPVPKEPVKIAIIGTGSRSTTKYQPLYSALKPWVEVVAVCDPVAANADKMAKALNVPAYYDIHKLVADKPMEACIVITPIESHHSISVYLSENKIHNLVETAWCSTVIQAKDMVKKAEDNGVIVRVAENFLRFPIDRFSQQLKKSGYIGDIKRIFCYDDHTGFHNNSRWIAFAGSHPISAQAIHHRMPTRPFQATAERFYDSETFRMDFFEWEDGLMVADGAANIKGFLGRHDRPGYTEWQGTDGTLVSQATFNARWKAELRKCTIPNSGNANVVTPVIYEVQGEHWTRIYADTPEGYIGYENQLRPEHPVLQRNYPYYGPAIMEHIVDFSLAIRGLRESEFSDKDALMSMMMQVACMESARNDGIKIKLPIIEEFESERLIAKRIKERFGVDMLDVEGMLAISYPKP